MFKATNVVALVTICGLVTAGLPCLARIEGRDALETWRRQAERLKLYIYLSAAIMIIGVLFMKAWASYPTFLFKDVLHLKTYTELANALATFTGVQYSLILSSYALPVALLLSSRADAIAAALASGTPHADLKAVRQQHGLSITAPDILKSLVALLAPFLTGTVASLSAFTA